MFELRFTQRAVDDMSYLKKWDQKVILDAIKKQLSYEPLSPSNNRKKLRENILSEWELRVNKYRRF